MNQILNMLFAGILLIGAVSFNQISHSSMNGKIEPKDTIGALTNRFADLQLLTYKIPEFDKLSLQQKQLAYYLYQAALSGRDILYDQKYKYGLTIRRTIEGIYDSYKGDRNSADWKEFMIYAKRVWFSNGNHHHYSQDKIIPAFSYDYFKDLLKQSDAAKLPLGSKNAVQFAAFMKPIIFDKNVDGKLVNLDKGADHIKGSANNFYEGLTQKEVEDYYKTRIDPKDPTPVMYGLNSKLMKENGQIVEKVWKVGGMYSAAIEKIVYWLEKAVTVAENSKQKESLEKLITFYKTGDLKDFDAYNIAWIKDVDSRIDVTNGFIEVYGDALGMRGSYESVLSIKDMEATKRIAAIGNEAQWFEDHSPIMPEHKKKEVKGISAKVITVCVESGDAAPYTPIGINLPNSNWIRQHYGSKSVSLGNIVDAYNVSNATSPNIDEFYYDQETKDRQRQWGAIAGELHIDMHEVIGHASGKLNEGVATPEQTLKNYNNALEEGRADLVGLYYIMDQKLVDMGVMPSLEVGKASYDNYILNGMMLQLNRLEPGNNVEEAHMRNRQLIAHWVFEKGKKDNVIEKITKDGKTYFKINDYNKLRTLFGELLREIQRIKSEGDYKSAAELVENYGVKADQQLIKEVKARFEKLNIAPYKGFIQPKLVPVMQGDKIVDVKVEYTTDFVKQMMEYGKDYSFLPDIN
jgi:dipeptidyl-peptidase III